ncbi:hypothetical protein CFC21_028965, partial [Triticum aestivum]
DK